MYLFINSMSRTGTSLLYQLLCGHPDIFFPPYRIQFACSKPLGFPLKNNAESSKEFAELTLSKTTTPLNLSNKTDWSNIEIKFLDQQGMSTADERVEEWISTQFESTSLDRSIDLIHSCLGIEKSFDAKYHCLHDDHAYVLGSKIFKQNPSKILTTIRSPLDMLASKKNMLLFHLYKTADPKDHIMNKEALQKELTRALFSWLVASYEYSERRAYYPVLFEHLKGSSRCETMRRLCEHIDISFDNCLETDKNQKVDDKICNELIYAGSSLRQLTKGKSTQTVGSSRFSLSDKEKNWITSLFDFSGINSILNSTTESFYLKFHSLWKEDAFYDSSILKKWFEWYISGNNIELFEEYSSYNYGGSNAKEAF